MINQSRWHATIFMIIIIVAMLHTTRGSSHRMFSSARALLAVDSHESVDLWGKLGRLRREFQTRGCARTCELAHVQIMRDYLAKDCCQARCARGARTAMAGTGTSECFPDGVSRSIKTSTIAAPLTGELDTLFFLPKFKIIIILGDY